MTPKIKVSQWSDRSFGKRDVSARATHLKAGIGKVSMTTIERKIMSTKTTIKRIALVAAASLGLGVLSIVPANAAPSAITLTLTNGAATLQSSDSRAAGSINLKLTMDASDSLSVQAIFLSGPNSTYRANWINLDSSTPTLATGVKVDTLSATPIGQLGGAANPGIAPISASDSLPAGPLSPRDSILAVGSTTAQEQNVRISSTASRYINWNLGLMLDSGVARTAGTYSFSIIVRAYTAASANSRTGIADQTASGTLNIVVTDATAGSTTLTTAAGTSSAIMSATASNTGTTWQTTAVDSAVSAPSTPSTSNSVAVIKVTQASSTGVATVESITASTTIGNIGDCSSVIGKSVKLKASSDGVTYVCVFPDGSGGTATIKLSTTSVTFSDKQVTFYSTTVSKITAVKLGNTIGGSAASVILAKAYDAANVQIVGDSSVYAYSSDLNVINTGSTTGTECTYNATYGGHLCSLTGALDGTATITLRNKSTVATSTVTSADTISLNVSTKSPVAIKMAFDKATYAPGEVAYIRLWAVDAAGAVVSPGTTTNLLASGGITTNVSWGNGSDTTTSVSPARAFTTAASGYASADAITLYKVYMPYTGGTVTITATGGGTLPAAGQVAVTASATVTDNGASALAAVTALASQVSAFITKINAQITTLTDLVMKIQKKVKA